MAVFLVTGASRGLGRSIATAALAAGHSVVTGVRSVASLDDLAAVHGDRLRVVALDVTDEDAARDAVAVAVDAFGRLDVVVNNAGYANIASIEEVESDDFRDQIGTNLFGVVNVTRAALPVLRSQRSGHIIQISSVGGRLATPGLGAYQTAKWAVGGFSSVLATEVGPLGIKVTVLEPGGIRTDWAGSSMRVDPIGADYRATVGASAQMHGSASMANDPDKVAAVVLHIADMEEPPLRLLVGQDAYTYATAAGRALLASDEQWATLSASTTADGATIEDLDPLGSAGGRR